VSFADNLQRLREAAGFSQMELCRRTGISIDSLRNWEQARVLPRVDAAVRLALALGVKVDDLTKNILADETAKKSIETKTAKKKRKGK
jgi:transcriptional regulator with XRE-family HTH domain